MCGTNVSPVLNILSFPVTSDDGGCQIQCAYSGTLEQAARVFFTLCDASTIEDTRLSYTAQISELIFGQTILQFGLSKFGTDYFRT